MRVLLHSDDLTLLTRCALAAVVLLALQACGSGANTRPADDPAQPPANPPPANPPTGTTSSGLDARPVNATCSAWQRPASDSSVSLTRYTDLTFRMPVAMLQPPNDSSRWFVVEQAGVVYQFATASPQAQRVIDITDRVRDGGEMGLLGMAFHPNFPQDPRVFLSYTSGDTALVSRISAFTSRDNGATLDPASEQVILTIDQPEQNHNGGHIAFGPDGYLYIGVGDGGGAGDQHGNPGNAQSLTTMLGKMLRIDVNAASPYGIPATNPFAQNPVCPAAGRPGGAQCPEIYAWGLRNPWRWSFDRASGELWVADVGQGEWEEVNQVQAGGNYGWRCREGAHDFNSAGTTGCGQGGLIDPVTEYDHSLGASITGGYVYRGTQNSALVGRYLFADFVSGRIWAWIAESATSPRQPTELLDSALNIASFGQAHDGELYIVDHGGTLQHIAFLGGSASGAIPQRLSETGCVSPSNATQPASGLIAYTINAGFWSDGAQKNRWLALPDTQRVSVNQQDTDWDLPPGSVLMKEFALGTRRIETRLLMRHPDGAWGGYTYEWNSAQTDATLVQGGAVRDVGNGQNWIFPSEAQCLECHTSAAGRSLGLETAQLNRTFTYALTGRSANQLATLDHIGVLAPAVGDPASQPTMPDPADSTAALDARARAYLHTNCSQCHRPGGPTPSNMDLRYATALASTNACNAMPQSGDLGLGEGARLIAPGSAANSLIVNRTNRRDAEAMPPLASSVIDSAGVALLTQWIDGLSGC